jgi:hypothetical protein
MPVTADLASRRRTDFERQRTCHPELHHEHGTGLGFQRKLLPMPMGGADDRVRENRPRDVMGRNAPPLSAALVKNADHVASDDRHGPEATPDEMGLERSPKVFDFREFRHGTGQDRVCRACCTRRPTASVRCGSLYSQSRRNCGDPRRFSLSQAASPAVADFGKLG